MFGIVLMLDASGSGSNKSNTQHFNTSQASCPLNKLLRILMAGAGSRPTRKGGQGRGGRAVVRRSRSGTRPRPTPCPPPPRPPPQPPPQPSTADKEAADADASAAAAALANINESPAMRTRRQLMLAIQSGSNAAAGRRGRDDNVLDESLREGRVKDWDNWMLQVPIPLVPATLICEDYLAHRQELEVTRTAISTMKTLMKKTIILTKKNGWFRFRQLLVAGKVR